MTLLSRIKKASAILLHGESNPKRTDIPQITEEEIREIKQFFPREKFFILGHARSGTTILMRLVRLHPEIHCSYQAHFFTRHPTLTALVENPEIENWLSHRTNRWNRGRDLSPLVLRSAADFILERDAIREGKRIVGDKSPTSTIHAQAIRDMHRIYPDAKLIYIVRDGRDVLISLRMRNFVEDSKFLLPEDRQIIKDLKNDPAPFADGRRSIFTEKFIRRVGNQWSADLSGIEAEAKKRYPSAYLPLRYEALLANPFEEIKKVWDFLGVQTSPSLSDVVQQEIAQNPDEEWQAHRNESISSFLPRGKAGNWRNLFSPQDKAIFKEVAGDMLIKWGYEQDNHW